MAFLPELAVTKLSFNVRERLICCFLKSNWLVNVLIAKKKGFVSYEENNFTANDAITCRLYRGA